MDDSAIESLRQSLWNAVSSRDYPTLAKLCMDHEATIERVFMEQWRVIPSCMHTRHYYRPFIYSDTTARL